MSTWTFTTFTQPYTPNTFHTRASLGNWGLGIRELIKRKKNNQKKKKKMKKNQPVIYA